MKISKIIAGLIGTAAAIAAVCSISIFAGAEQTSGFWKYTKQYDGSVYITGYTGFADKLVIPSKIDGIPVKGIDSFAFVSNYNFNSVDIPSNIEYIGNYAFNGCGLKSVSIPSSVTYLGSSAFEGCDNLTTATINSESIGFAAFLGCDNLTTVTLGSNVKYLDNAVFSGDEKLKTVNVKGNLLKINGSCFRECYALTSINLGNKLYALGANAFTASGLKSVTIPSTVVDFEYGVFSDCDSLTTAVVSCETVGDSAFYGCDKLSTVTLGKKVIYIGDSAFEDDIALNKVIIKGTLYQIDDFCFEECSSLTSIDLGSRIYSIGTGAFKKSGIKSITVPSSVTYIGGEAFAGCDKLTSAYFGYGAVSSTMFNDTDNVHMYCFSGSKALDYAKNYGVTYSLRKAVPSTSIKLRNTVVLEVDQILALDYTLSPSNSNDGVTWETGSSSIINCQSGILFAKQEGITAVRATTTSGKTAICNIIVIKSKPNSVLAVKLSRRASSSLTVKWTPTNTADGYIIEKYSGGKWSRVAKITNRSTSSYTVKGLKASTKYPIRVKSYKMVGSAAAYSNYVSGSWTTAPSDVAGLKLKGRASDALRLSWNKNTSADGYIIEQKSGSSWKRIAKLTKNTITEYRISGLKAGTAYSFRIRSYNMVGKTALYSGYKSISARTNPTAVGGLYLKGSAKDAVRLAWNKNTSAGGYIIERKSGNKWIRVTKITNNSTTQYRISGLKSKTSYTFRVRTYKMSGKTPLYGAAKTITVRAK